VYGFTPLFFVPVVHDCMLGNSATGLVAALFLARNTCLLCKACGVARQLLSQSNFETIERYHLLDCLLALAVSQDACVKCTEVASHVELFVTRVSR